MVYWSLKQHGVQALSIENNWFVLGVGRSELIRQLPGGMSEYTKHAIKLFYEPIDFRVGLQIQMPPRDTLLIFAEIQVLLADEAAIKEVCQHKGSAGTRLCPLCVNVIDHKSDILDHDASGKFVPSTNLDFSKVKYETDTSARTTLRWLQDNVNRVNKEVFTRMQQFSGYNLVPSGLFMDEDLQVPPVGIIMYDWMHTFVAAGLWQLEMGLLLDQLKTVGVKHSDLHVEVSRFIFPKAISSRSMTGKGMFEKKRNPGENLKCSASEALSMYSIVRFLLREKQRSGQLDLIQPAVQSYFSLARVLDLLQNIKKETTRASMLKDAILKHLYDFQKAYGLDHWIPKHHIATHLAGQFNRHQILCACFTHERKHKLVKRYSSQVTNTWHRWERSVVIDSLRNQLDSMRSGEDKLLTVGLIDGSEPTRTSAALLRTAVNSIDAEVHVSLHAYYAIGAKCSSQDVVLLNIEGEQQIGTVRFFAQVGNDHYVCYEMWHSCGQNEFSKTDEQALGAVSCIHDVCTYVSRGGKIAVVPNSTWMV